MVTFVSSKCLGHTIQFRINVQCDDSTSVLKFTFLSVGLKVWMRNEDVTKFYLFSSILCYSVLDIYSR